VIGLPTTLPTMHRSTRIDALQQNRRLNMTILNYDCFQPTFESTYTHSKTFCFCQQTNKKTIQNHNSSKSTIIHYQYVQLVLNLIVIVVLNRLDAESTHRRHATLRNHRAPICQTCRRTSTTFSSTRWYIYSQQILTRKTSRFIYVCTMIYFLKKKKCCSGFLCRGFFIVVVVVVSIIIIIIIVVFIIIILLLRCRFEINIFKRIIVCKTRQFINNLSSLSFLL
jgi:hypothetical protein